MNNVHKFLEKAKSDAGLLAQIDSLDDGDMDGLLALGTSVGLPFTAEDYLAYVIDQAINEMNDDELNYLAGGASPQTP